MFLGFSASYSFLYTLFEYLEYEHLSRLNWQLNYEYLYVPLCMLYILYCRGICNCIYDMLNLICCCTSVFNAKNYPSPENNDERKEAATERIVKKNKDCKTETGLGKDLSRRTRSL